MADASNLGTTAGEVRNTPDEAFYRWVNFISAATIGIALAALWNSRVADPIAMGIQRTVVGTTTPAELATALALAFVAGASMMVTA
jgi:hypothetical protein